VPIRKSVLTAIVQSAIGAAIIVLLAAIMGDEDILAKLVHPDIFLLLFSVLFTPVMYLKGHLRNTAQRVGISESLLFHFTTLIFVNAFIAVRLFMRQ